MSLLLYGVGSTGSGGSAIDIDFDSDFLGANLTLSSGDDRVTRGAGVDGNWRNVLVNKRINGNRYWEIAPIALSSSTVLAIVATQGLVLTTLPALQTTAITYNSNGVVGDETVTIGTFASYAAGDRVGVAVDSSGNVYFSVNGTYINSGNPAAFTGYVATLSAANLAAGVYPGVATLTNAQVLDIKASASELLYSVPTGYARLDQDVVTDINLPQRVEIATGSAQGWPISYITTSGGGTSPYVMTLVDSAGSRFQIATLNGVYQLQAGSVATDVGTTASHNITIRSTDFDGFTFDKTIPIPVRALYRRISTSGDVRISGTGNNRVA